MVFEKYPLSVSTESVFVLVEILLAPFWSQEPHLKEAESHEGM